MIAPTLKQASNGNKSKRRIPGARVLTGEEIQQQLTQNDDTPDDGVLPLQPIKKRKRTPKATEMDNTAYPPTPAKENSMNSTMSKKSTKDTPVNSAKMSRK